MSVSHATSMVRSSCDEGAIAYTSVGSGPSVIVVPGALATTATYRNFAGYLAERFAVHVIERRGRGASCPQGADYGIAKERDDVLALQQVTGASYLVGHSYGGLIALEAARGNAHLAKLAVYEPGISIGGSIPLGWIPAVERWLALGKPLDALAEFSLASGPEHARRMPRWLMRRLLPHILGKETLAEMIGLLPTTIPEHRELARLDGSAANYREISASVLLMSGGRSRLSWVNTAFEALVDALPRSQRLEFPSLNHFGLTEGDPQGVAEAVGDYFHPAT